MIRLRHDANPSDTAVVVDFAGSPGGACSLGSRIAFYAATRKRRVVGRSVKDN